MRKLNDMESFTWLTFFWGLFTGILISVITNWVMKLMGYSWRALVNFLIKKYNRYDVDIEGDWIGIPQSKNYETKDYVEKVTIYRTGNNVKGIIETTAGPYCGRRYVFTGLFRNSILTATYKSEDCKNLEQGSYSIMLTDVGNTFVGFVSYCLDAKKEIKVSKYLLERKK